MKRFFSHRHFYLPRATDGILTDWRMANVQTAAYHQILANYCCAAFGLEAEGRRSVVKIGLRTLHHTTLSPATCKWPAASAT